MKTWLLPLVSGYAALAALTAAALTAWNIPCYTFGLIWVAVTGLTVFFFAFALERKRPKTFVWVVLGGGFLRMTVGVATVVLPLSLQPPEGYRAYSLQFAAFFLLAQGLETWIAVRRVNRLT